MGRRDQPDSKIGVIASAILIFSVLSFGAVEIWSSAIMEVSVFTLMIIWLIQWRKGPSLQSMKEEKYLFFALCGFLAYTGIQMIPFPSIILKYLSPESFNIYSYYTTDKELNMSISLYAYKTEGEFLRMLTYSICFTFLTFSIKDMLTLRRMLKVLIYFGFGLAIFAIIQKAMWNGKLYWFRELGIGGSPFGPFVNRNHYAGLIGMLIPLSLGLAFTTKRREKQMLFGFLGLIMAVSLFLSLSRAGIISFFAGITVFVLFLVLDIFRGKKIKKIWALGVFVFMVIIYLLYLGIDPVIDRFYKTDVTGEERFRVWLATINAFKDFYLTGSGLGTFINIFPFYSPENIGALFDHAHNDYLEFLLEAGIIGTALLLLFLFFFVRCMVRGGWDGEAGMIKISFVSSITTMVVHSIFDFNLHIPSNALMLSAIFGMTVASSRLSSLPAGKLAEEGKNP